MYAIDTNVEDVVRHIEDERKDQTHSVHALGPCKLKITEKYKCYCNGCSDKGREKVARVVRTCSENERKKIDKVWADKGELPTTRGRKNRIDQDCP